MSVRWTLAIAAALVGGLIMGIAFAASEQTRSSPVTEAIISGPAAEVYWFESDTEVKGYTKYEKGIFAARGVSVTHNVQEEVHATVYPDWVIVQFRSLQQVIPRERIARLTSMPCPGRRLRLISVWRSHAESTISAGRATAVVWRPVSHH